MASTTIATAIEIVIQNHIQGGHRRILCAEQIIQHWKLWDPQISLQKCMQSAFSHKWPSGLKQETGRQKHQLF